MKKLITIVFLFFSAFAQAQTNVVSLSGGPCYINPLVVQSTHTPDSIVWKKNGVPVHTAVPVYYPGTEAIYDDSVHISKLCLDDSGYLYGTDNVNNCVYKWTNDGNTRTIVAGGNGQGSGANQFHYPTGVCVDHAGNIYVSDFYNNRVQKWAAGAATGITVAGGNGAGSAADQLYKPAGLRVDANNNLYIADQGNNRIQKWAAGASTGTTVPLTSISNGSGNTINSPEDVAIDDTGNLFIISGDDVVIKIPQGTTVGTIVYHSEDYNPLYDVFYSLALDDSNNIYTAVDETGEGSEFSYLYKNFTQVHYFESFDTIAASQPRAIARDRQGCVYIAFAGTANVVKVCPAVNLTYTPTASGSYTATVYSSDTVTTNAVASYYAHATFDTTSFSNVFYYFCPGDSVSVYIGGAPGTTAYVYSSDDDSIHPVLIGASGNYQYNILPLGGQQSFVIDSVSSGTCTLGANTSSAAYVWQLPVQHVNIATHPLTCGEGDTLVASAFNASYSYLWSPAAGLSDTDYHTVIALPQQTTTYTVVGTTQSGCKDTETVTVNGIATGNKISGYVDFTAALGYSVKVWLLKLNESVQRYAVVDSTMACNSSYLSYYYSFVGKPNGIYTTLASLSDATGNNFIPTYSSPSLYWDSAQQVTHTSGYNGDSHTLLAHSAAPPTGAGTISGYIYNGVNGTAPAKGIMVYLRNLSNAVLYYTYTDDNGKYIFNSLPSHGYNIYPEHLNYTTTPSATVTVSSAHQYDTTVNFRKTNNDYRISPIATAIESVNNQAKCITVYPNPAKDILYFDYSDGTAQKAQVSITDVAGRIVLQTSLAISAGQQSKMDISALKNGIYFVNVHSDRIGSTIKLTVLK